MASSSPRLTVLGGSLAGKELTIEDAVDNVLVGSDPSCRFCLDVPNVSPIHARLWIDQQGITVYDTNAPQGLYINDDRVVGQAMLRNGDILWLGPPGQDDVLMIQCRIPRAPAAAEKPSAPEAAASAAPPPAMDETALLRREEPAPAFEPLPGPEDFEPLSGPEDFAQQTVVLHDPVADETAAV